MNDVCHRHDDDSRGVWLRDRDISHIWHDKTKSPNRSEIPNGQCNQSVINLNNQKISFPLSPSLEVVFSLFVELHHVHSEIITRMDTESARMVCLSICRWWINDRLTNEKAKEKPDSLDEIAFRLIKREVFNRGKPRARLSARSMKILTVISPYRLIKRRERTASLSAWSLTTLMTDRGDKTYHSLAIIANISALSLTRSSLARRATFFLQSCIEYKTQTKTDSEEKKPSVFAQSCVHVTEETPWTNIVGGRSVDNISSTRM